MKTSSFVLLIFSAICLMISVYLCNTPSIPPPPPPPPPFTTSSICDNLKDSVEVRKNIEGVLSDITSNINAFGLKHYQSEDKKDKLQEEIFSKFIDPDTCQIETKRSPSNPKKEIYKVYSYIEKIRKAPVAIQLEWHIASIVEFKRDKEGKIIGAFVKFVQEYNKYELEKQVGDLSKFTKLGKKIYSDYTEKVAHFTLTTEKCGEMNCCFFKITRISVIGNPKSSQ